MILTNEGSRSDATGQINGFELLVDSGELGAVSAISHRGSFEPTVAFDRVLNAVKRKDYDLILIWTPNSFPSSPLQFEQLSAAIGERPVQYWEGDACGSAGAKNLSLSTCHGG